MCQENASLLNGIGFALLIAASLMCALSFSAPFWIYYPNRYGIPNRQPVYPRYPFKLASWRGLWAVCFKEPNRGGDVSDDSNAVSRCAWFWQKSAWNGTDTETDLFAWKTIPNWYLAAEGVFAGALILLLLALIVETLYACCHCCLRKSCAPTSVACFIVAAALMCVTSLALFGGYSFNEGDITVITPELEWAFFVGVGGAAAALLAAILFYVDGCRLAKMYSNYKPPAVTVS